MLLECAVVQEYRDEYYTADSLNTRFETIPEICIVEFSSYEKRDSSIWYKWLDIFYTWITPDLMEFVNFN